jgi:hypothetical protein
MGIEFIKQENKSRELTEQEKEIRNFALSLEDFYRADDPQKKEGIGHEIEHIKGVVARVGEVVTEHNKGSFNSGRKTILYDRPTAVLAACLHDIGNVVSRENHNFLGQAILVGKFSVRDLIENNHELSPNAKKKLLGVGKEPGYIEKLERNEITVTDLPDNFNKIVVGAYVAEVKFHMAYDGLNGRPVSVPEMDDFIKQYISNPTLAKKVKSEIVTANNQFKHKDAVYNKSLSEMTKNFAKIAPIGSPMRENVLIAIREHNVDFTQGNNDKRRHKSPNPYVRLIFDCDKEKCPEVFAIRTMAYAKNHFGYDMENPTDQEKIKVHVLHQANERYRYSKTEWCAKNAPGENSGKPQPPFTESFAEPPIGYKPLEKCKFYDSTQPDSISPEKGVDIYYQTSVAENYFKNTLATLREWSRVDLKDKSMETMQEIFQVFHDKDSIEAAVDYYEAANRDIDIKDWNFTKIVTDALIGNQDENIGHGTNTHVRSTNQSLGANQTEHEHVAKVIGTIVGCDDVVFIKKHDPQQIEKDNKDVDEVLS